MDQTKSSISQLPPCVASHTRIISPPSSHLAYTDNSISISSIKPRCQSYPGRVIPPHPSLVIHSPPPNVPHLTTGSASQLAYPSPTSPHFPPEQIPWANNSSLGSFPPSGIQLSSSPSNEQHASSTSPTLDLITSSYKDSSHVRREWVCMLQSVLHGDILRREAQRLFYTSSWTEPDKKYALWLALRAVAHGNSINEERNHIESQRIHIDRRLDDLILFTADPRAPLHVTRARVATQLDRLHLCRDLYPTEKALRADYPRWGSPDCQSKMDLLQTWLNMVSELVITVGVFRQWSNAAFTGVHDYSDRFEATWQSKTTTTAAHNSIDSFAQPSIQCSPIPLELFSITTADAEHPNHSEVEGGAIPTKEDSIKSADPGKILDALLRGRDLQHPLERRFVRDLPRYLQRLRSTVIRNAEQFSHFNLPVPFDTISELAQLPVRVVQELQRIRLAYADKVHDVTAATLEQLLNDFKATLVIGIKAREEFLDFFSDQPGWTPKFQGNNTLDLDLFQSVRLYFRMLQLHLSMDVNRNRELEALEAEWHFCSSLLHTTDPIHGLDVFIITSFCQLGTQRFTQLQELYLEIVKGSARLERHLDVLKLRSRNGKRFYSLLSSHTSRAAPLVLDIASWVSSWPLASSSIPETGFARLPKSWDKPTALNWLSRPQPPHLVIRFVQRLFDKGYRLIGHTADDVYFFSHNPLLNVLEFICALPCNPQVLNSSNSLIIVHFPHAPPLFTCSPLISPRAIAPIMQTRPEMKESKSRRSTTNYLQFTDVKSIPDCSDYTASSLLPTEMLCPVILIVANAEAVLSASLEFQDLIPPSILGRGMAYTRRAQLATVLLESTITRYSFSLLNGINLVKDHYEDAVMEALYLFASDFTLRFSRLSKDPRRLLHRLVMFTVEWINFTCVVHAHRQQAQPNRKTFRWALFSLEFALNLCRSGDLLNPSSVDKSKQRTEIDDRILNLMTDTEFNMMRVAVGHCMALLISHFESFSPQLPVAESAQPVSSMPFFAATQSKMKALEAKRTKSMRANRLIGRVLDRTASERSLASLSSSPSSISIRWQHGKFLGGGTYGSVFMGINLSTGELMAVKEIRIHDTASFASLKRMVSEEMKVMERINHPHVIAYYGIEVHQDKVYLFMEYAPGGTLSSLVSDGGLEESVIKRIVFEILLGIEYLHSHKIVHRDIKPDNILLDAQGKCKLVDFGAAKILSDQGTLSPSASTMSLIGTPNYLAPETVVGSTGGHLGAQDIWSLGCVMYELYTGRAPWSHLDNQWAIIYHCAFSPPPIHDNFKSSKEGLEFLKMCLRVNPLDRPTAKELLNHPFLADEMKRYAESTPQPEVMKSMHLSPDSKHGSNCHDEIIDSEDKGERDEDMVGK